MTSPLTPSAFWILTVLASGRHHGYEILREATTASGGQVSLKVATLYAALERLEAEGAITADGDEIVDGRARRYFVLTEEGSARLAAEAESMRRAAEVAERRLAGRAPGRLITPAVAR